VLSYILIFRVADSLSDFNLTLRKCSYYKDKGIVYEGYLLVSHGVFLTIVPEAIKPGVSQLTLTEKQIKQLIK
jgi:hypothetical protein